MRKLIENPTYMTYKEMEQEFIGKWILITNCNYTEHNELLGGVPVAVADKVFEGQRDGFYNKFKDPKYAPRTDHSFDYDSMPSIFALDCAYLEIGGERVW